jgi:8-oxo-dGTP diphosphatase
MGREEQRSIGQRYMVVPRTLCFLFHGRHVLLLKGAPDKRLWPNRYNGIGGHLEAGEDVATAARREIQEETGLAVHDLRLRGVVTVNVEPDVGVLIAVFTAATDSTQFTDSAEGQLAWFPVNNLPADEVVPDVPALLERLDADPAGAPPFSARYHYDSADRLVITFAPSIQP